MSFKKSLFATLLLGVSLCAKEVSLGVVLPVSGALAAYGQDVLGGIELANQMKPSLKDGSRVKLVVLDSKGDKLETANATTRLIAQDKVIALIGEAITANTIQAISIAESKKVPIIAPVASGDKLLNRKSYASRVCFMDSFQGEKFADYTYSLGLKNVVLITDQSNVYSLGLAKAFEDEFSKRGGKVLKKLNISSGDKDFKAIASQIKSLDPDFVYMPIYHPEAALLSRNLRQVGFNKLLSAGDGVNNNAFVELGGEAVNGVLFTDSFDHNNPPTKLSSEFIDTYEKIKGTRELPAFSAMGADAYLVALNAMDTCINDLNSNCVNEAIHNTTNLEVVGGLINIDKSGNASRPVVIKEIQNGKQVFKTLINP